MEGRFDRIDRKLTLETPAGWYRDANGDQRYWDGSAWTGHVVPTPASAPASAASPVMATTSGDPYRTVDPYAGAPVPAGAPRKPRVGPFVGIGMGTFLLVAAMTVSAVLTFLQQREAGPQAAFDDLVSAWQAKDCPAEFDLLLESTTGATTADYCDGVDYSWAEARHYCLERFDGKRYDVNAALVE